MALKAEVVVEHNGVAYTVQFENGSFMGGVRRGGYCTITDENIQKALEEGPFYQSMYTLTKTKVTEDEKPKEKELVKPVVKETPILKEMPEAGIFPGITNSQKAKAQLLKLFPELTHAQLPNKEAIIAFAEKHEITFPDWEK